MYPFSEDPAEELWLQLGWWRVSSYAYVCTHISMMVSHAPKVLLKFTVYPSLTLTSAPPACTS